MKTKLNILLIIFICLSAGCNKSERVEPSYGLISARVQGINKQFIPRWPYPRFETSFTVLGNGPEQCPSSLGIRCPISIIGSPGTYTLKDHGIHGYYIRPGIPGGGIFGGCGGGGPLGSINVAIEGTITFTVITDQRLKGTFNFTTDSFRVTNGTFDVVGE